MNLDKFPIQVHNDNRPPFSTVIHIPYSVILNHDEQAKTNHCGQDLHKLCERGGLSPREAFCIIKDEKFSTGKGELIDLCELLQLIESKGRNGEK